MLVFSNLARGSACTRLLLDTLEHPQGVAAVRGVEPQAFAEAVATIGLADAGALLAAATREQSLAVLDTVAFAAGRGADEPQFAALGFAAWLSSLSEWGPEVVVRRLLELPEELRTAGFCGQFFVLDLESLLSAARARTRLAELADQLLETSLFLEFERYTLVARHELTWDTSVAALMALDRQHHDDVLCILEACEHATRGRCFDSEAGLEHILRVHETIEVDAVGHREDRREAAGYVSLASARSFMALAEQTQLGPGASWGRDPVTRAHFRIAGPRTLTATSLASRALPASLDSLTTGAREPGSPSPAWCNFREALVGLGARAPQRCAQQIDSLTYLANLLITLHTVDADDKLDLDVLSHRVIDHCARGLEHIQRSRGVTAATVIADYDCDVLFRVGFRIEKANPSLEES